MKIMRHCFLLIIFLSSPTLFSYFEYQPCKKTETSNHWICITEGKANSKQNFDLPLSSLRKSYPSILFDFYSEAKRNKNKKIKVRVYSLKEYNDYFESYLEEEHEFTSYIISSAISDNIKEQVSQIGFTNKEMSEICWAFKSFVFDSINCSRKNGNQKTIKPTVSSADCLLSSFSDEELKIKFSFINSDYHAEDVKNDSYFKGHFDGTIICKIFCSATCNWACSIDNVEDSQGTYSERKIISNSARVIDSDKSIQVIDYQCMPMSASTQTAILKIISSLVNKYLGS